MSTKMSTNRPLTAAAQNVPDPYITVNCTSDWAVSRSVGVNLKPETHFKFNEDKYLEEIRRYIEGTYEAHYSTQGTQMFELIDSSGHADGFTMGNILKYASRYGKKNGHNRKDLLKIIHYAMLQLYIQDKQESQAQKINISSGTSTITTPMRWDPEKRAYVYEGKYYQTTPTVLVNNETKVKE